MAQQVDRFKTITMVQGAADAFVQGSVATDIISSDGMGWLISLVEVKLVGSYMSLLSADADLLWALSRDTKAVLPNLDDTDAIYTDGFAVALTTSGQIAVPLLKTWVPPAGTIVVEPILYAQLDSTATGQAQTVVMRIHYDLVKLSEIEILRLLNNA